MAKKATTPTPKELVRTANAISTAEDRRKAIHATLRTEAESGHYGARFSRFEYPYCDFVHLRGAGFAVLYLDEEVIVAWDKDMA